MDSRFSMDAQAAAVAKLSGAMALQSLTAKLMLFGKQKHMPLS